MNRKNPISLITEETASPEALEILREHRLQGRQVTNMKRTLLHSVPMYRMMDSVMESVNAQLAGRIPQRSMLLFFRAIARGNGCRMCGSVFDRVLEGMGVGEDPDLTEEEADLLAFAEALTQDPNHVPDPVYERLQSRYDEETMVVLVMNAVFSLASNYFNTINGVEPEERE